MKYLSLIRGINVGGNSLVKMVDLKTALEQASLSNVRTYIQSGNVFFESDNLDQAALAERVSRVILENFGIAAGVVVFTKKRWQDVIKEAPAWWGKDHDRKYNLFVLLPPYDMAEITHLTDRLDPEIEAIEPGDGVLYQSISLKLLGKITTGKLANYKGMTVRNYNTASKLLELF